MILDTTKRSSDVVICGGGLSGLLLAEQLRQELPDLSVTVIERTSRPLPESCHKVGESSVELASQYLERLGLTDYLLDKHIVKLGLRFFPGGGHLPLEERTEVGPCAEPVVRSYQLDRGIFESDLRGMIEDHGVHLVEGARVSGVVLGEGDDAHEVLYEKDGEERSIQCRWVVDAAGRHALLRRKLKQSRGAPHQACAGWFRIAGRFDINDLVPQSNTEWHERACGDERWRSTNHFMGAGYWVWVIPLGSGNTSIGIVLHEELHSHKHVASYEDAMGFIREFEPQLARHLEPHAPLDYKCLRKYSHLMGRAWSHERWAMVGEAGAFVDPLYSPGSDFIALSNCFTTEMIRVDLAGGDLKAKAAQLNGNYRSMFSATLDLFRNAAPVYGHPPVMATKIFWDNFTYWSFTCHIFQQDLYRLSSAEYEPFVSIGQAFLHHGSHAALLMREWALLTEPRQDPVFIGAPHFPSVLIDAHTKTGEKMTVDELLEYLHKRVDQLQEIAGELLLRAIQEVGPENAPRLLEACKYDQWQVDISAERLETESLKGHPRRIRLTTIARDLERTVGKIRPHAQAAEARALLVRERVS